MTDEMQGGPIPISVVLPTYFGEAYIKEQLESISRQSRLPDELVILDDASEDRTREIVEEWSWSAPFPVQCVFRRQNVGLYKNLSDGIQRSNGAIIVLSDQDDIWAREKLRYIEFAFARATTSLWFSNADLVDASGHSLGLTAWDAVGFDKSAQRQVMAGSGRGLLRILRGMTVTGATMAFSRHVAELALPLPENIVGTGGWLLHDGWLALMGFLCGDVVAEPESLISYRQHAAQATGQSMLAPRLATTAETPDERSVQVARTRAIAEVVRQRALHSSQADDLMELELYRARREQCEGSPATALANVVANLRAGSYHKFGRGWPTAARDIGRLVAPSTIREWSINRG